MSIGMLITLEQVSSLTASDSQSRGPRFEPCSDHLLNICFDRFHFHGPAGETLPPLLGVKSDWTGKLTHVMYNKTKLVIHFADWVCAKEFALNL